MELLAISRSSNFEFAIIIRSCEKGITITTIYLQLHSLVRIELMDETSSAYYGM